MKGLLAIKVATLLLALLLVPAHAEYDVATYCQLVGSGIKLASIDSCRWYYVCKKNGAVPSLHTCPEGEFFDKNAQACQPEALVDCISGHGKPQEVTCAGRHKEFIAIAGTCDGYIYCVNGIEYWRSQCGPNMIFADGLCVYGQCPDKEEHNEDQQPQPEQELRSVCQVMPNKLYFGDTASCHAWLKCQDGNLTRGNCPMSYVFNVESHMCDYEQPDSCSRVTGTSVVPELQQPPSCEESQTGLRMPDIRHCNMFWLCTSQMWIQFTCAPGQHYDSITHHCRPRADATPAPTCNRCEGTNFQFTNMVDPQCQHYAICEHGQFKGDGRCPLSTVFSEIAQACVYTAHATNSTQGPCYNPTLNV